MIVLIVDIIYSDLTMKILVQCRQGTQELKDQLENKRQMLLKNKEIHKENTRIYIYAQ